MSDPSPPSSATDRRWSRRCGWRQRATVSFDPNIRPFVTPDREAIGLLSNATFWMRASSRGSEEDLEWLYPGRWHRGELAAWAKSGPRFCVGTLGERGALAMLGNERIDVPAPYVEVVDTVRAARAPCRRSPSAMDRDHAHRRQGAAPNEVSPQVVPLAAAFRNHPHAQGRRSANAQGSRGCGCGTVGNRRRDDEIRDEPMNIAGVSERSQMTSQQEQESTLLRRATLRLVLALLLLLFAAPRHLSDENEQRRRRSPIGQAPPRSTFGVPVCLLVFSSPPRPTRRRSPAFPISSVRSLGAWSCSSSPGRFFITSSGAFVIFYGTRATVSTLPCAIRWRGRP